MKLHVKSLRNKFQKPLTFSDATGVINFLSGKNTDNYKIYTIEDNKEKKISLESLKAQFTEADPWKNVKEKLVYKPFTPDNI